MRNQALTSRQGLWTMTTLTCLATTVACGGGAPPELSSLTDQVAQVGTELKIDLLGTDPDGDQLQYKFRAPDLEEIADHAAITVSPSGSGVFRWTPLASDVGEHAFDFVVSDGDNDTTRAPSAPRRRRSSASRSAPARRSTSPRRSAWISRS
jgi:hypothetical protein